MCVTKSGGAVYKLVGQDAILRDFYKLEEWANRSFMKVNKGKDEVLNLSS